LVVTLDADVAHHLGVVRQDAEAAVAEEVLATELPAVQGRIPLVDRLVHAVGVQRVGRGAGDVIGRLERDGLRLAAVVRRQATGLGRIADQRGGGEQVGVVALATHGRIATGGADLRGARGALQERVGRLRVRTGGRVGQAV